MNSYTSSKQQSGKASVIALLLGAALGAAASSALLCLFAAIFVKAGSVPLSIAPLLTSLIGAVGAFCAGYFTVKLFGSRGLMMGMLSGVLLFFAITASGAINGNAINIPAALVRLIIFAVCGGIGGIVRVNRRVKVKKYQ